MFSDGILGGVISNRLGPIFLALLIVSGQVKENPLMSWVPFDMTVAAALLTVVSCVYSRGHLGPATGRVALPWLLWLLFIPAVALSPLDEHAIIKILTLFTVTFILALAPFYLLREAVQLRTFLASLAVVSLVVAATTLSSGNTAAEYTNRVVLEGADTIGTARIALAGALIMALLAFFPGTPVRHRIWLLVACSGTAVLGILTGSRGPVLAGVIGLLLVVVLGPVFRKYRGRSVLGLIAIGAALVGGAIASQSDGIARIMALLAGETDTSVDARKQLWGDAIEKLITNPLGLGWGGYISDYTRYRYPHNLILEVGVEAGWFVGLAFVGLLVATTVRGARVSTTFNATAIFGLYLFGILNALVSSDINGSRLMIVVLFVIWVLPLPGYESKKYYSRLPQLVTVGSNSVRSETLIRPSA